MKRRLNWHDAASPSAVLDFLASNRRLPRWRLAPSPIDRCAAKSPADTASCRALGFRHRYSGTSEWYCTDTMRECVHKRRDHRPGAACLYDTGAEPNVTYAHDRCTRAVIRAWREGIAFAREVGGITSATAVAMRDYDNPAAWEALDALAAQHFPRLDTNQRRIAAQERLAQAVAAYADAKKRSEV